MKQIVLIAVGLEVAKISLIYLIIAALDGANVSENETIVSILFVALYLLVLPEMMVSYEHGPHSVGAYAVMLLAGIVASLLPAWIIVKRYKG